MPNIATILKDEISRLARRETRRNAGTLKKASAQYRRDIAQLKRMITDIGRRVAVLEKVALETKPQPAGAEKGRTFRFTVNGLKSQRKRLGISAAEYGALIGVTQQSVYNWERGVAKPRKEQVAAIAALRGMGKKEAKARLRQVEKKQPRKAD